MPPLNVMIKPASGRCNLACAYCFYRDLMQKRDVCDCAMMTQETLEQTIRCALSHATQRCTFSFQGGEPLLASRDFFETVLALQKKWNVHGVQIENNIQTNGTLLDEAWVRFLQRSGFLVGISLDGIRDTHEVYRKTPQGDGTFDAVMQSIGLLKRYRVPFNVLTVVHEATAAKARQIYAFYRAQGLRYVQFIPCLEPFGETDNAHTYTLTPQAYGTFLTELFSCWYADLLENRQLYIRQFENYLALALGQIPDACEMRGICGRQYAVEADGRVYPCDFYATQAYCIGNVAQDTIAQMDARRETLGFVQQSAQVSPQCGKCPWFFLCRGGCMRMRNAQKARLCDSYQMFFRTHGASLMKIAQAIRRMEGRRI